MICENQWISKIWFYFRIAFIVIWISNLASTDAFFSVYVILGFAAFYCTLQNSKTDNIYLKSERLVFATVSILFSLLVLGANYPVFTKIRDLNFIQASTNMLVNILNSIFSFTGGIFVSHSILVFLYGKFINRNQYQLRVAGNKQYYFFTISVFVAFLFIFLTHLFLVEYPGNVTEDPFTQIDEMYSGQYSNFNTFWHTIFMQGILSVGYFFFGEINAAVAFYCAFQAAVMAAAFAYCLGTLYLSGVPKLFLLLTFLIFGALPYNIALSITIWKDVLFSAGCLLMLSALFRLVYKLNSCQILNYIVFILGGILFSLSRNNGWYIYLASLVVFIWPLRHYRRILITMISVFAICWIMTNPVLSVLHVSGGDYTESLSVPLQQVSRVIADGNPLTEEESALISQVLDIDEVPDLYTNWISDPIKVEFRSNNTAYFEENITAYVKLWIKLGIKYPGEYFKAWVDQTKGYWNAGYGYGMYSESITDNPYGVAKSANRNLFATLSRLYFGLSRHVIFFEPLHSIGLHVWITAICCLFNALQKRKEWLLAIPLLILVLGLCLGTPVYASFRYVYPVFVSFPLVLGTTMFPCSAQE